MGINGKYGPLVDRGDVFDFFPKPVKIKELKASMGRALAG